MKILFVHDKYGFFGGAESNVFTTASELKLRGHELALAYSEESKNGSTDWAALFERAVSFEEASRDHSFLKMYDIAYVHKCASIQFLKLLKDADLPVARMVHDHELYCLKGSKYSYWNRHQCTKPFSLGCVFPCGAVIGRGDSGILPFQLVSYSQKKEELELNKTYDHFIVASEFMKMQLVSNGFEEDKISIHPLAPQPKGTRARQKHHENVILYVGQVTRGKGVDLLIKALAEVPEAFQCFIVGDGNFKGYCERLVRNLNLEDRIYFSGFTNSEELQEYYSVADVLVVPSVWPEPFGLVGLEAMSHGIPVVSFDVGGVREWLRHGHNGLICREKTASCLAENIRKLISVPRLAVEMGANGKDLFEKHFSIQQYIDGIESVFKRIAIVEAEEVVQ